MPLSELNIPLGTDRDVSGMRLGDLGPDDHVIFYPKSAFYWLPDWGLHAKASLVIAEPRAVHGWHMSLLKLFHRRFFRVLTRDRRLIASIPNAVFHNHTFSYLSNPIEVDTAKSSSCSLIASGKRDLPGHRLRHRVVDLIRSEGLDVDIMGRGYAPFETKEDGLARYRFSVVIENSREPAYISEKLVDAALCRTVPIYWGAPDVDDWFDPDGLIVCKTEAELLDAIRSLPNLRYDRFSTALERNRTHALELMNGDRTAAETLVRELAA